MSWSSSLQAALNTLDILGSFSGLKINTIETKTYMDRKENTVEKIKDHKEIKLGNHNIQAFRSFILC